MIDTRNVTSPGKVNSASSHLYNLKSRIKSTFNEMQEQ